MRQFLLVIGFALLSSTAICQGITLKYVGTNWTSPTSWIQINTPVGQTPIQRVPTELDDVLFHSVTTTLVIPLADSLQVGLSNTTGAYRCRSMRMISSSINFTSGIQESRIIVSTMNGGYINVDSGSNIQVGTFFLRGGNPAIADLTVNNSSFGMGMNQDQSSWLAVNAGSKAVFNNATIQASFMPTTINGGNLSITNSTLYTGSFHTGNNATTNIVNTPIKTFVASHHWYSMDFRIGRNTTFTSSNISLTAEAQMKLVTSGQVINGNVAVTFEIYGSLRFEQIDPADPLPNIINGNVTVNTSGLQISGDLKISGNLINVAHPLFMYPDTAQVVVNGNNIFTMGGIMNYGNNSTIISCTPANLNCRYKLEFFGSGNSNIHWPIGFPIDTLVINKTGCAKVTATNSLYVSGNLKVQSGQLVLNPNSGIAHKLVSRGNVNISQGGGIFLRRNSSGEVASMAVGGTITDLNPVADSTCNGLSNPYNGSIITYTPATTLVTVSVCINGNINLVSDVQGTTYQWQRNTGSGFVNLTNSTNVNGTTTPTLQLSSLPASWNTYEFKCIVNGTFFSKTYKLNVASVLVPAVTVSTDSPINCLSSGIIFIATPVHGGTNPIYQWQVNGVNAGTNNNTFGSTTLNNNDQVRVLMQSNLSCASPSTAQSNTLIISAPPLPIPSVTIVASSTSICSGSSVTFTATLLNVTAGSAYQWQVNGINAGTNNPVFTTTTLNNNDIVRVRITGTDNCFNPIVIFSNAITMTVSPSLPASVSIQSTSTTICSGASVTFTATPVNEGTTPAYQWQVNGVNAGTNNPIFTTNTLNNNDVVKVILTSNSSCANTPIVTSNTITMSVTPGGAVASVSIQASATNICNGTSVMFTATPVNGGATPVYQWQVNGTNAGTNSNVYTTTVLNNNDVVKVSMISNASCVPAGAVISNSISMVVTAPVAPSINISGNVSVITGSSTVLSSSIANGGNSPLYQWQDSTTLHSWQHIPGAASSSISYLPLADGGKIRAVLTSSASCITNAVVNSNVLEFIVRDSLMSGFKLFPNPVVNVLTIDSMSLNEQWSTLSITSLTGMNNIVTKDITGSTRVSINVQGLSPGMYFIVMRRKDGSRVSRVFVKM